MKEKEINPDELYPWGGDFKTGNFQHNVAVVILNSSYVPSKDVAIYGKLKTENIGIEKIIANVISNPFIRFLIICGSDIRGHRCGESLACLHKYGIDENNRIINAPGAIPYIENIQNEAIVRFQQQIDLINLIDVSDEKVIDTSIDNLLQKKTSMFGSPFIAIRFVKQSTQSVEDKRALHSRVIISYIGKIEKRR